MKSWFKENWWKLLIFIVVFIISGPILINVAFKESASMWFLRAEWTAGDALSFYGVIIASIIAVYGVFLTIQYTQKNYQEDTRNRVLPFFSINLLRTKIRPNWDISWSDDDLFQTNSTSGYEEYEIRDYYITVKDKTIKWRDGWTSEQKKLLESGGIIELEGVPGLRMQSAGYFCLPIESTSIGNGPALNVRCGLNLKSVKRSKRRFCSPIPAAKDSIITVHIFFENALENSCDLDEYVYEMTYQDILGNRYLQSININLEYDSAICQVVCKASVDEQVYIGKNDTPWIYDTADRDKQQTKK